LGRPHRHRSFQPRANPGRDHRSSGLALGRPRIARGTGSSNPFPSSGESTNFRFLFAPHAHLSAAHTAGEETVVYLARNWKFESTPLQQRVCELSVPERRDHFPARTP
jgi:hypothetical protein